MPINMVEKPHSKLTESCYSYAPNLNSCILYYISKKRSANRPFRFHLQSLLLGFYKLKMFCSNFQIVWLPFARRFRPWQIGLNYYPSVKSSLILFSVSIWSLANRCLSFAVAILVSKRKIKEIILSLCKFEFNSV